MDALVDVHTHIVPESFPDYLGRHIGAPWPSMAPAQACHKHVMVSGAVYRTVSHACWDCAQRRTDMQVMGVGRQVLSPMPELLSYWLEPEDGAAMCRFLNETIATMVADAPGRFYGLAAVPLQDVGLAISELEHAVSVLGLAGVEIAGNINGTVIGDARFLPFFQAAAQLDACVFVHPLRPAGMDRLVGPASLEQVLAFPGETGLAAASMITGGTFSGVPGLRIAFSHGGGTLSTLLPRLQHAWDSLPPVRQAIPMNPSQAVRSMYFDDLVYDAAAIRRLVDIFGKTQIMVGTDYPFTIMDPDPAARLASLGLDADTTALLRHANAMRWLGVS